MELEEYVAYAQRVARSMWRDPEAESIANEAAWRAYETYKDPVVRTGNYTEEGWIALLVRQSIWSEWRKQAAIKRNNEPTDGWWEDVISCSDDEHDDPVVNQEDWQLLCERYVDGWPVDVIARRHEDTVTHVRRRLAASLRRFTEEMERRAKS